MGFIQKYMNQVNLLLEVIPSVAKENCFALKGGSAINMFYQNLPRLSVDLDLVYLPVEEREKSYKNINAALMRIKNLLSARKYEAILQGNNEKKIICSNDFATVKIEPNYTIRGCLIEPKIREVTSNVQENFAYAKMKVLAVEELYAGKICAALDRQHPRDLFDIKLLFDKFGGISDKMLSCFIVYALGHNRPLHELLDCSAKDNSDVYEKEFMGMTDENVTYNELIDTLNFLKMELKKRLVPFKDFLLDFVRLNADFSIFPFTNISELPAIKWKVKNLETLALNDKEKFDLQYTKLKLYFMA